jgi:hypothetical protein
MTKKLISSLAVVVSLCAAFAACTGEAQGPSPSDVDVVPVNDTTAEQRKAGDHPPDVLTDGGIAPAIIAVLRKAGGQ